MNLVKEVQAVVCNPVLTNCETKIQKNPIGYFNSALQSIISIFFIFGLIYFIYHFVLAGYSMISSMGDPKKYEAAQHALLYSFVGIVIIFSVFALLKVIGNIFGIEGLGVLQVTLPTL